MNCPRRKTRRRKRRRSLLSSRKPPPHLSKNGGPRSLCRTLAALRAAPPRGRNVPWRLLRVDERQPAGEIETKYGTYFDSMGPREFMAYAVLFARMYGLGMLSIYGGAAGTLKNPRQRHLAHCRELNDPARRTR